MANNNNISANSNGNSTNNNNGTGFLNFVKDNYKQIATGVMDLATSKYVAKSIAEQAKRSIMMYKVLESASIGQVPLASDIGKYLESMYGIFTMIMLGYNPMAANNSDVSDIIDSISAESYNPLKVDGYDTKKAIESAMTTYEFKEAAKPRIGKHAMSTEVTDAYRSDKENAKRDSNKKKTNVQAVSYWDKDGLHVDTKNNAAANEISQASFVNKLDNSKSTPTIINMTLELSDGSKCIIPIAIKANCTGIGSEELRLLLESAMEGKPWNYLRFVKWRTGEISTMAWIFGTDLADRDAKIYKKLGHNPWYIELQQRKLASTGNAFIKHFAVSVAKDDAYKELKDLTGYKGDIPPTMSLIVTKDDLISATHLDISHFTKNESFVKQIMKTLYLLCFGIVDMEAETVTFFFLGYREPFYQTFSDLQKGYKDPNQTLFESINELARKV